MPSREIPVWVSLDWPEQKEKDSPAGQAAGVAGVRKGRSAHPPESWKVIYKKINKKEKMIALYSAISSTAIGDLAKQRSYH